jgi:polyphosphate kinase
VHLGTGNYNPETARQYEDMGMFTCDEEIGKDATDLFNYLTGYSAKQDYQKLIVAPINLRLRLQALIEREIQIQRQGGQGYMILKANSLVDQDIIRLLYEASQAGVRIDLIIRGICSLRPQVAGLSENIQVRSIVGRFLEHSRIYYFNNADQGEIFLGSADLMTRNIERRVEVLFPVQDARLVKMLHDEVLQAYLKDNVKARRMLPDGNFNRFKLAPATDRRDSQSWLLAHYRNEAQEDTSAPIRKKL